MKLIANIERIQSGYGKAVKLTFPTGKVGTPPERIIARNIGPRPWSEISFWKDGRNVIIYSK